MKLAAIGDQEKLPAWNRRKCRIMMAFLGMLPDQ